MKNSARIAAVVLTLVLAAAASLAPQQLAPRGNVPALASDTPVLPPPVPPTPPPPEAA